MNRSVPKTTAAKTRNREARTAISKSFLITDQISANTSFIRKTQVTCFLIQVT